MCYLERMISTCVFPGNYIKSSQFQHGLVRPPGSAVAPVTVAQDGEKHAERLEQNIENTTC